MSAKNTLMLRHCHGRASNIDCVKMLFPKLNLAAADHPYVVDTQGI
jgi:hypothetical protein